MLQLFTRPATAALLAAAALLASCGGGGGGGSGGGGSAPGADLGNSEQYAGFCDVGTQKLWVRAYLDENYLWYDEIRDVDRGAYANAADYFNALLVRTPDANGWARDRFSTVLRTGQAQAVLAQSFTGVAAFTGGELLKSHTDAVPVSKVVRSPAGRRTGYIRFDDFEAGAQDDMITAVAALRDAGVQDLVLDMRANSGGYVYIAQAVASMVAGPSAEGKVFEKLNYNDKRDELTASSVFTFSRRLQLAETQYPANSRLPQLDLPRLYMLTSKTTCSSSESVINGLRGIDIDVVLVGDTTCGKPYGFQRRDNCGYAYFPIEFRGTNDKGEGNYTTGFAPTCRVADNDAPAGSASDPLLTAALFHVDNGKCPAASASATALSSSAPSAAAARPVRPAWAGRLLRPQ